MSFTSKRDFFRVAYLKRTNRSHYSLTFLGVFCYLLRTLFLRNGWRYQVTISRYQILRSTVPLKVINIFATRKLIFFGNEIIFVKLRYFSIIKRIMKSIYRGSGVQSPKWVEMITRRFRLKIIISVYSPCKIANKWNMVDDDLDIEGILD